MKTPSPMWWLVELPQNIREPSSPEIDARTRKILERNKQERDPKENSRSRPPDGEEVEFVCLWVVEFYAPSHLHDLQSGLRRLGLDEPEGAAHKTPVEWIQEARSSAYGAAWWNLGVITPPDGRKILPRREAHDFPDGVEFGVSQIEQVVPSHSALTMQFVFADELSNRLDRLVHQDFESAYDPVTGGVYGAAAAKERAIDEAREEIRRRCCDWFRKHLPGVFSSGGLNGSFPTCEFLLFQQGEPFRDRERPIQNYMWTLDVSVPHAAKSRNYPGCRLGMSFPTGQPEHQLILAAREKDLFRDEDMEMYGGREQNAYIKRLESFGRWFTAWSTGALLDAYEQELTELRDGASSPPPSGTSQTDQLHKIAQSWSDLQRDALPFADELLRRTRNEQWFYGHLAAFEPPEIGRGSSSEQDKVADEKDKNHPRVLKNVRTQLRDRCKRLQSLLTGLGDVVVAESNLGVALASTQLQKISLMLTTVVASAAVVSLVGSNWGTLLTVAVFLGLSGLLYLVASLTLGLD